MAENASLRAAIDIVTENGLDKITVPQGGVHDVAVFSAEVLLCIANMRTESYEAFLGHMTTLRNAVRHDSESTQSSDAGGSTSVLTPHRLEGSPTGLPAAESRPSPTTLPPRGFTTFGSAPDPTRLNDP